VQYGISIPNFGPYFDVRRLATLAHDAEEAGWDGFFLWDHVYWALFPISDPWMALTVHVRDLTGHEGAVPFAPQARQQPRIPVWVGGRWPNKPPFRRGARWDGIIPTSVQGGIHQRLTPQELRECVGYTMNHRTADEPLEVAIGGHTDGNDLAQDQARVAAYQQAGATWWLEDLSPWAFGWQWEGDWPVARMEERVRQGPPR